MPTLADRLHAWWRARQRRRIWNALTPEQQMTLWTKSIDSSPALREMFRKVLRVHGYEREAGGKLQKTDASKMSPPRVVTTMRPGSPR